jgi:lysophospholipase L1-like esterase
MFRSTPALAVASVLLVSAACSQSPTAPTALPGAAAVAGGAQTPTYGPADIQPQPQAIGATRFLAFGDSITAGVQSSFDGLFLFDDLPGSYPSRLLPRLQGAYPAQGASFSLINEGVPGEWASDGERRLRAVLDSRAGPSVPVGNRTQALLVLEGINDMNNGVSATRAAASLAQLVQIGRLYNLTVLVATMPQTYTNTGNGGSNSQDKIVPFNAELIRLVGGLQNVRVVDLYAAFGSNRSLMGGDGLHPTPEGYEVMAARFYDAARAQFPVRGGLQ